MIRPGRMNTMNLKNAVHQSAGRNKTNILLVKSDVVYTVATATRKVGKSNNRTRLNTAENLRRKLGPEHLDRVVVHYNEEGKKGPLKTLLAGRARLGIATQVGPVNEMHRESNGSVGDDKKDERAPWPNREQSRPRVRGGQVRRRGGVKHENLLRKMKPTHPRRATHVAPRT